MVTHVTSTLIVSTPSDREIVTVREFEAPRERIFQAFLDRDSLPRWWGPRTYETIVDVLDARPSGSWRFRNRDSDGNEYAFRGEFREIVSPERIVQTFQFEPVPEQACVDTVLFEEIAPGRTRLTTTSLFATPEDRDSMLETGMEQGAAETYDRLAELLLAIP
jgi:uncharacterized protein YndB with AHSA1/START domain